MNVVLYIIILIILIKLAGRATLVGLWKWLQRVIVSPENGHRPREEQFIPLHTVTVVVVVLGGSAVAMVIVHDDLRVSELLSTMRDEL